MGFDNLKFFRDGLLLSADEAARLDTVLTGSCIGLGAALGAGVGIVALKEAARTPAMHPLRMAGLAVGGGVISGSIGAITCLVMKSKLRHYLARHETQDTESAIRRLTAQERQELRKDAYRLVKLAESLETPPRDQLGRSLTA